MDAELITKHNNTFSKSAIEEKTIMFIESYYNGPRGLISKIFKEYLADPVYNGYKLVWVAQDYDETLRIFGSWLDSDRIWLCVKNGYDYIRYLNTSKYIYSSAYLPAFYTKRDGQVLYYAPLEFILVKKRYTKAMLWRFAATVNQADYILVERGTYGMTGFTEKFKGKKIIDISYPKEKAYHIQRKKTVFISLMDRSRGAKNLNVFQFIYNTYTNLAAAYGYDVFFKIPLSLYNRYRDEENIFGEKNNVYSSENEILSLIQGSAIMISDSFCDLISAGKYNNKLLYFSENVEDEDETVWFKELYSTDDFGVLSDIFEKTMKGEIIRFRDISRSKDSSTLDYPQELKGERKINIIKRKNAKQGKKILSEADNNPRVLILAEICGCKDIMKKLHDMLVRYKNELSITVLFRGTWKGELYEQLDDITTDINYICRSGNLQCSEKNKETIKKVNITRKDDHKEIESIQSDIKEEWRRMLGRDDFDHTIGVTGKNVFWLNMYRYLPSTTFDTYEADDSSDLIVQRIEELIIKYKKNNQSKKQKKG